MIDVIDSGAVGDGVTDDIAAFEAARDSAEATALGGARPAAVYAPGGRVYKLTRHLDMRAVPLICEGRLLSRAGGGAAALRLAGRASDYYIHEIRRDTAGGAPVMAGSCARGPRALVFRIGSVSEGVHVGHGSRPSV